MLLCSRTARAGHGKKADPAIETLPVFYRMFVKCTGDGRAYDCPLFQTTARQMDSACSTARSDTFYTPTKLCLTAYFTYSLADFSWVFWSISWIHLLVYETDISLRD
jgi:hypothetical protein